MRGLYDLAHALEVFEGLDAERIVEMFGRYLDLSGQAILRARTQERMFAKLAQAQFFRLTETQQSPRVPLHSTLARFPCMNPHR